MLSISKQVLNDKPKDYKTIHSCCYFRLGDKIVSEAVINDYQTCHNQYNIVVEMEDYVKSLSMKDVVKCDELWTISHIDDRKVRKEDFVNFYRDEIIRENVKNVECYHSGFVSNNYPFSIKRKCVFIEAEKLRSANRFPYFKVHNNYISWASNNPIFKSLKKKYKFCFHFRNSSNAGIRNLDMKHYLKFAEMLKNSYDCDIVNIGSREDVPQDLEKYGIVDFSKFDLSVGKTAAIMKLCDIFVGGETGTTMLAAAIGQYILAVGYVNKHAYPYTDKTKYYVLHKQSNKEPELRFCKSFFDRLLQSKLLSQQRLVYAKV